MRILYVDRDVELARSVADVFLPGHDVVIVATTTGAHAALARQHFDVALVDPDLTDGPADVLVHWLRATGSQLRIVAVAVCHADAARLLDAGADASCTELSQIAHVLDQFSLADSRAALFTTWC
jgi:DNA-binding response OmpR family regulator